LDEKHHYEGVSEAKKSEKYLFSTQNCSFSSKKASFGMKNIILKVYQKLKSQKNTCFRRKIASSLRKKHPFGCFFRRAVRALSRTSTRKGSGSASARLSRSVARVRPRDFEGAINRKINKI
jgi:hypothetical protein